MCNLQISKHLRVLFMFFSVCDEAVMFGWVASDLSDSGGVGGCRYDGSFSVSLPPDWIGKKQKHEGTHSPTHTFMHTEGERKKQFSDGRTNKIILLFATHRERETRETRERET